ncbi:hypothetical protein CVT23_11845 [Minwuia thermotolerans]|uniref:Uncharacterized protein n=1 Tax=Minwuia thermotolerans TaxID=2056226 RepID=A0A2M9G1Z1_9PROT|nr:hypothetical protein CVT23_11845 [Minwuia thermotolerans]
MLPPWPWPPWPPAPWPWPPSPPRRSPLPPWPLPPCWAEAVEKPRSPSAIRSIATGAAISAAMATEAMSTFFISVYPSYLS